MFLVIMYLQGGRGLRPIDASLVLVPGFVLGGLLGPWIGKITDTMGPVLPATGGLALQAVSFIIYAQLTLTSPLWLVIVPSVINGVGAGAFFPANTSAVMKAAPRRVFGIASGMLRTFANIGMVFSFTVAILVAAHSIPRGLAFAIFVGSTSLHGKLAATFVSGVHAAFYSATVLVAIAALLSALRGRHGLAGAPAAGEPAADAAR
jgi:MFS family permease